MEQLLTALPQLADIVQKGGVVGLLLIVCGVLVWEVARLRKQAAQIFAERENYRLHYAVHKQACDQHGIKVDTSALAPVQLALPAPA
jgi:hypothetical protein